MSNFEEDGRSSPLRAIERLAERWQLRLEAEVTIAVALAASMALAFVLIAGWSWDGSPTPLDEKIMLFLRTAQDASDPIGPKWLEEGVRDITALGSTTVLSLVVIGVTGVLALSGRKRLALMVLISTASGTAVSHLAKYAFGRPRPDLVPHHTEVYTASFPSAHAMMAAVVYLVIAVLVARAYSAVKVRAFIMAFAVALMLLVGISRVYLGVHWPTDVLAGWALGAMWATLCWIAARGVSGPRGS